jgi:predicted secreted Zn-dependent protease
MRAHIQRHFQSAHSLSQAAQACLEAGPAINRLAFTDKACDQMFLHTPQTNARRSAMKSFTFALALIAFTGQCKAADWQPREVVKPYSVFGTTGPQLYESIGDKGPLIGQTRTIALTNWDLKWSRNYTPDGSACVLVSAKPFLTITYSLPKPAEKLGRVEAERWRLFADGIAAHERVHGRDIVAMVNEILAVTVGLRVENDRQCQQIRKEVLNLVKAANETYKAKSRAFDQSEMSEGGNVQRLILTLVNGQ